MIFDIRNLRGDEMMLSIGSREVESSLRKEAAGLSMKKYHQIPR